MALKVKEVITKAIMTTSGNTSMAESLQLDLQNIIISQLKSVVKQIENN